MANIRLYYINRARQKKAYALCEVILERCADLAQRDVERLIEKLKDLTATQWANMARMARVNPPSMATCEMVFDTLRE